MTQTFPRLLAAGDGCVVVEFGDGIDLATNARVQRMRAEVEARRFPGVREMVPTYRSLAIYFDPCAADAALAEKLAAIAATIEPQTENEGASVEIPVLYGGEAGPDLENVAKHAGITPEEVITRHCAREYYCYMLGFTPGFAYLGGMDESIAAPRLTNPRTLIPAGSVGIAGKQTGIYPIDSPGGWQLIGRTPLRMFDPAAEPPTLLDAGMRVRFVPVDEAKFRELTSSRIFPDAERRREPSTATTDSPRPAMTLEILKPGLFSTVQDGGRWGYQGKGIPVAGAMDQEAHRIGNALVGNDDGEAAIEITLLGPMLRVASGEGLAAVAGDVAFSVNGQPAPNWSAFRLRAGDEIAFPPQPGRQARAYLCISGGIDVQPVLGSRSTYARASIGGFEGRPLKKGDIVPAGEPDLLWRQTEGFFCPEELRPARGKDLPIRVVLGPQSDAFTEEGIRTFLGEEYVVTDEADRMGYRLDGPQIAHRNGADIVSDAVPIGAVQVPGHGRPICMLADRQTTGGYTKIAVVAGVDLGTLAQRLPGEKVRFVAVSAAQAQDAARAERDKLLRLRELRASWRTRPREEIFHVPVPARGRATMRVDGVAYAVEWEERP